jgi:hypothetical protein
MDAPLLGVQRHALHVLPNVGRNAELAGNSGTGNRVALGTGRCGRVGTLGTIRRWRRPSVWHRESVGDYMTSLVRGAYVNIISQARRHHVTTDDAHHSDAGHCH